MAGRVRARGGRFLRTNAFSKGLIGGQRGWAGLFFVLTAARFFGKYVGRDPQYLSTETLKIGESMTVTALPPPLSRRKRRKARRRAAAAR
ncbi:MAG: hypothetical protein JWL70_1288 [Acidimicrobiia bacterium]|nr:hypothetical protein [Acidimicrobiia bacterium]